MRRYIVSALLVAPTLLFAQARTVSPGMTRSQVVAALGEPATARTASEYSYLFYPNACGKACGMNDLVILRGDSVVDAIFRSPDRHYTGVSSSPTQIQPRTSAKPAPKKKAAAKTAAATPATTEKAASTPAAKPKQMTPPKEANDARPSIPANPTPMKPAPSKTPATTKPAPKPT